MHAIDEGRRLIAIDDQTAEFLARRPRMPVILGGRVQADYDAF